MNKKGFLLAETTLKIVIAVICIMFLVYFLTSLYFNNKNNQELKMAEASLDFLVTEINAGATEIDIYNPEKWVLTSWPHFTQSGVLFLTWNKNNGLPASCDNVGWQNCLCLCEGDKQKNCDKLGYCVESNLLVENDEIKFSRLPIKLNFDKTNNLIKK